MHTAQTFMPPVSNNSSGRGGERRGGGNVHVPYECCGAKPANGIQVVNHQVHGRLCRHIILGPNQQCHCIQNNVLHVLGQLAVVEKLGNGLRPVLFIVEGCDRALVLRPAVRGCEHGAAGSTRQPVLLPR